MTNIRRHVFISHIKEEESLAAEIASGLEAAGYPAWYYERDKDLLKRYPTKLANAIENSAAILVLISRESLRSKQVLDEVLFAGSKAQAKFSGVRRTVGA